MGLSHLETGKKVATFGPKRIRVKGSQEVLGTGNFLTPPRNR